MRKSILISLALLFCFQAFAQTDTSSGNHSFSIKKLKVVERHRDSAELFDAPAAEASNNTQQARISPGDASGLGVTPGVLDVSLTGSATYSIPIATPPGINGVQPKVALSYSSMGGNGIAGWGWSLAGLSAISRTAPTKFHDGNIFPISFDQNDRFALDGQRLRLKSGTYGGDGAVYETESFSQLLISSHGVSPYGAAYGPAYFKVTYPDGSIAYYGNTDPTRTQMDYAIAYMENPQGLRVSYSYVKANNGLSISSIQYGSKGAATPVNQINFVYATRQRPEQSYTGGLFFSRSNYLSQINVIGNGITYRTYNFTYDRTPTSGYERLISVQEKSVDNLTKPAISFNYSNSSGVLANGTTYNLSVGNIEQRNAETVSLDFTGDGKMDFLVFPTTGTSAKSKFWLFTDIQNSSMQLGWEVGTGAFVDIFPSSWLTWNNKVLAGQGLTIVQNDGTDKVKFKVYSSSSTTPVLYQYEKQWTVPMYSDQIFCDRPIDQRRVPIKYLSGDFNGDGLSDVMAVTMPYTEKYCYEVIPPLMKSQQNATDTSSKSLRIPPDCECETWTANFSNVYFLNMDRRVTDPIQYVKYTGNFQQAYTSSDKLYTADYNGDGKTDILHVQSGKVTAYGVDGQNNLQMLFTLSDSRFSNSYPLMVGDFNGDGKGDLLTATAKDSYLFAMFLSTGKSFVKSEMSMPFQYKEAYWDGGDGVGTMYTYNILPTDINGDGKTDVLDYRAVTRNSGTNGSQSISVYLGNSTTTSSFPTFAYSGYTSRAGDLKHYPIPVFVSSNRPNFNLDFATISDNRVMAFEFRQDNREDILLRSVTNNGITQSITYHNLDPNAYNSDGQSVYTQDYGETFPYVEMGVSPGTKLVTRLDKFGIYSSGYQTMSYHSAVSHSEGLGFLGFKTVTKSNWNTGSTNRMYNVTHMSPALRGAVVKEFTSLSGYIPSTVSNVTAQPAELILSTPSTGEKTVEASRRVVMNEGFTVDGAQGTFVAQTVNNTTGVNDGASPNDYVTRTDYEYQTELRSNKVFLIVPVAKLTKNLLAGTNTSQYYSYDEYFNAVENATYFSNDGSKIVKTTFSNNTGAGYHIGRPLTSTTITQVGSETHNTEVQYTYTGYVPTSMKTRGNGTGFVTENRIYDGFGNVTQKTIVAENGASRIYKTEYDPGGRFITKTTDPDGMFATKEYNTSTGDVTKETDQFGLATVFEYDGWGRPTKATDYLNNKTVVTYQSMGNDLNIIETGDDGSSKQTYYDALGRPYRWFKKDVAGQWMEKQARYDHLDRKVEESEPYIGSLTQWNKTEFDVYGRTLKNTSYTGKILNYTYNGLAVTINDGTKSTTTVKDAMGNTIRQTDPGGTVTYSYFANGHLKSSTFDGNTVTIEQDGWGRKTKLVDPSAGTYSFTYNGFGEMLTETSPKGTTTNTFDAAGKLINRKVVGDNANVETVYSYDATSKQLNSMTLTNADGNSTTYAYTYDSYKRPSTTTETNPLAIFVKTLTYDNFGRTITEQFNATARYNNRTATKKIRNAYVNGELKSVSDDASGEQILSVAAMNARGQVMQATLGTAITQNSAYDTYGFPNELKVLRSGTEIMKLNYTFNASRALLSNRSNSLFAWNETFGYDNLDRLTTFNDNNGNRSHTYDSKGRITNNSRLGNYGYSGSQYKQSHVNLIEAAKPLYSGRPLQTVSFNAFKKPVEIREEGIERVSFQYNDELQRAHMFYGSDDADPLARPYRRHYSTDGSMEITHHAPTNKTSFVFYLDGNPYNASAIWKEEQSASPVVQKLCYLHRDYLGSIVMISDKAGTILEKRQFDAWGALVKLQDGAGNNLTAFQVLDRGYTGHEHLLKLPATAGLGYALINMNGRLYDPLLHVFISPDNHTQDPFDTQNYNRYAYALNSPLTYVDANGEIVWLPIIIGAVIGAYTGGVMANGGQYNPLKWDYSSGRTWGYMVGGAIVGGVSAGVGSYISASGIPFANTIAIAASSLINSVGTWAYTGGQTDISLSIGIANFNFSSGEVGYLGKKGNSFIETLGYGLGAFAVASDITSFVQGSYNSPDEVKLKTDMHSELQTTDGKQQLFSYGVNKPNGEPLLRGVPFKEKLPYAFKNLKQNLTTNYDNGSDGIFTRFANIKGVNMAKLMEYKNSVLSSGKFYRFSSVLPFGIGKGMHCVIAASEALNAAGVFNIPFMRFPWFLDLQMRIRPIAWVGGVMQ